MVSHEDLKGKFNLLAARINTLLSKEGPVDEVRPYEDTKVSLGAGTKRHFCIQSKMQNVPLRIRVDVNKGVGGGRMMFSQGIQRPTLENCDKSIPLLLKSVFGSYSSNREGEKVFAEDSIFISIESEKDLALVFQCAFGKGTILFYFCESGKTID